MNEVLKNGLKHLGVSESIRSYAAVSGGDINEAYYIRTEEQEYFVKLNRNMPEAFFEFERQGLEKIRLSDTVDVPQVHGIVTANEVPMLWLEWIEEDKRSHTEQQLGEQVACMHLTTGTKYGLEGDGFIGQLEHDNRRTDSWLEYYRDVRLAGQLRIGRQRKLIQGKREQKLVELLANLDRWVPAKPEISLLHGDLWRGNWIAGKKGAPVLIDPSILYGDHEFEIAYTNLFGGFSERFYNAYTDIIPLSDTYEEREPIYQLYYLLVHLNMFGEAYGRLVDRILNRYVKWTAKSATW
ncbi:fructosamine kinase family protein [Sporosarcina sp.]|uniref:fructosamine kinase family protein n=1 Tax=Sporosarcina sp. TaxID=49982 RepID=UPI00260E7CD4|nr:fructosamine kinase family protein [Sporosarcina sp.]